MTATEHGAETAAWTGSADAAQIAAWLRPMLSVVILTHTKPDGDAIGSSLGLARALNIAAGGAAAGFSGVASRAEVWYSGPMPRWADAVIANTKARQVEDERPIPANIEPDAVVVVDTGSWSQLEPFREWLKPRATKAAAIDHHLRGDRGVAERLLLDTSASAACEIVADVARRILGLKSAADLPREVAEPLYLGIATDTGWFRHSNTTPHALRTAADLLACGVDHERLYEMTEQRERAERLRLLTRALESLELHDDGRVAIVSLTETDFKESGAAPGESGGFLDLVRTVESVRVAALLTEITTRDEGVITKVSLRSKGGEGFVDVNQIAHRLGGGGHAQAAGARVAKPLPETKAELLRMLAP